MSLQTLASNKRVSLSYTKPLELVTATKPLELVTAGENLKITQLKRKQNGNHPAPWLWVPTEKFSRVFFLSTNQLSLVKVFWKSVRVPFRSSIFLRVAVWAFYIVFSLKKYSLLTTLLLVQKSLAHQLRVWKTHPVFRSGQDLRIASNCRNNRDIASVVVFQGTRGRWYIYGKSDIYG